MQDPKAVPRQPSAPGPASWKRRYRGALIATPIAFVAIAAAFISGRYTAPSHSDDAASTECAAVTDSVRRGGEEAKPIVDKMQTSSLSADEQLTLRTARQMAANLILQNPQCFSPDELAVAQTLKDQLNDDLIRKQCTGRWWEC
ncbi:hypothetical protein ABZ621_23535 [Streptomyces sp. NPDC007863]|uniref:hypothetical protein n=1 Tax=Streptomyces sp. NPDC007863 TaxID=3154894 RepID=UPI0034086DF6